FQCHGPDGKGGVHNTNAKTAEQVPSLIYVADGYTKDELKKFIMTGERDIPRMNLAGPESPHFMPSWGINHHHQQQRTGRLGDTAHTANPRPRPRIRKIN